MKTYVQTVRSRGKTYNYFRAGGQLRRNQFPSLRLDDDPAKATEQAALLAALSVDAAHGDMRDAIASLLAETKRRAKRKGFRFTLTEDQVLGLLTAQNYRCAVSDLEFDLHHRGGTGDAFRRPFAPSLDRITPSLGYTATNIRLVCCAVNIAVNEWGLETFLTVANAVAARTSSEPNR